jgi:hypothetical protein
VDHYGHGVAGKSAGDRSSKDREAHMKMSPGRIELHKAIVESANKDGHAENLKCIVETRCTLPLRMAYAYVRDFKDMEITRNHKRHGRPLVIKVNKEKTRCTS